MPVQVPVPGQQPFPVIDPVPPALAVPAVRLLRVGRPAELTHRLLAYPEPGRAMIPGRRRPGAAPGAAGCWAPGYLTSRSRPLAPEAEQEPETIMSQPLGQGYDERIPLVLVLDTSQSMARPPEAPRITALNRALTDWLRDTRKEPRLSRR